MNPSTEEILHSFENLPTDKVIVLPNNKNIIMAAQQATELTVKNAAVVPSVSIPQGICAIFALEREGSFENTVEAMQSSLNDIQSAELTIATRSVEIDGVQVHQGQVICLLDGHLASAGDNMEEVLQDTLNKANAEQSELITLYYGADLTPMQANQVADNLRQRWPQQEVEVIEGGQNHYHLIVSIE
jgi:hypothetical protein